MVFSVNGPVTQYECLFLIPRPTVQIDLGSRISPMILTESAVLVF